MSRDIHVFWDTLYYGGTTLCDPAVIPYLFGNDAVEYNWYATARNRLPKGVAVAVTGSSFEIQSPFPFSHFQ
jgi:hypothetical protein